MKDQTLALAALPDIAPAYEALYASLWSQGHIPSAVLELCRLRLAQLHNSAADIECEYVELPATKRSSLARWNTEPLYSEAEKSCIAFTEVYAMDAQSITDEHAAAVKVYYGDSGLVLLIEALGILDGRIRLGLLWQSMNSATGEGT